MVNRLVLLSLLCIACPLSAQPAIHKCANEGVVMYQDTPCQAGQSTVMAIADTAPKTIDPVTASPSVPKQDVQSKPASQAGALAVGMTDTEVLNSRGWGRPSKITRSKANRAWFEEWTYSSGATGQRLLQFANGRLTAIHTEPVQMAQITPQ